MREIIIKIDKTISVLSKAGRAIGCILILITAFMITVNSFTRYILDYPLLFVDEYARYMLVALFYLGLGSTLRAGKHVSADVVVSRFRLRTQALLKVITTTLGSVVIFLMLWYSWKIFFSAFRNKMVSLTPLETPLWIPNLFVALGLSLFLLDMIAHVAHGIVEVSEKPRG